LAEGTTFYERKKSEEEVASRPMEKTPSVASGGLRGTGGENILGKGTANEEGLEGNSILEGHHLSPQGRQVFFRGVS